MDSNGILEIIAALGGTAGIISIIKAAVAPLGKSDEKVKKLIREVVKENEEDNDKKISNMKEEIMESLQENFKELKENDITVLRHEITSIYIKYKDDKRIPVYQKQNWLKMYERYVSLGGNSYIKSITEQMEDWEEY